jgi:uncharacterized membrane protein YsdA (DUF1294 family)
MMRPFTLFTILTMGVSLAVALAAWLWLRLDPLLAWLLAVNLVTLLTYGYDKSVAGSGRMRVPERVLLLLALAGGSLAALVGMRLFHHKTSKESFQVKFGFVLLVQAILVVIYFLWRLR